MQLWTWDKLHEAFQKQPQTVKTYQQLPTSYGTFDEWQKVDDQKCEIIALVIGCRCAETLKQQQREAMAYRRTVCSTAKEWLERFTNDPAHSEPIRRITRQYARKKLCHRNWEGPKAGVRCYCDTHQH